MKISPGTYEMRNGHTAWVAEQRITQCRGSQGYIINYPFWVGRCMECDEPKTWGIDGRYSPTKKNHQWDIVEESACGTSALPAP